MVTYNQSTNGIYMRNVTKSMSQLLRLTRFCAMSYYLDIKLISNERYMILFHGLWIINLGNTLKIYSDDFYIILMKAYEKYLAAQEHLWMNLESILIFCISRNACSLFENDWLYLEHIFILNRRKKQPTVLSLINVFFFFFFCSSVA